MADFQGAFVQAGRDLKATNFGNGLNTPVTYLEVGSGTTAPTLTDTAMETPFHPPRRFDAPAGLASGDSYQFDFVDDGADAYSVTEVGIFSGGSLAAGGGTLLFRFVLAAAIAKPANTRARYPLVGQIAGEDLDSLSFAVAITSSAVANWSDAIAGKVQRATQSEAEATSGHSNAKGLSVLRGWQQLNAWWTALTPAALFAKLPVANATQGNSASNATTVMTPQRVRGHITNWWSNVLTAATLLSRIPFSSNAQAIEGIHEESVMNPLRTKEAIEALAPDPHVIRANALPTQNEIDAAADGTIWLIGNRIYTP